MPRYRPRIRQSLAVPDLWNPAAANLPTNDFDLEYRDGANGTGYVAKWTSGGNKIEVRLADLLQFDSTIELFQEGWSGLMQPTTMTCERRADAPDPAAPRPQDFDLIETHQHNCFDRIDGNGHPAGTKNGSHTHRVRLCEMILCNFRKNGVDESQAYPPHRHPLP